MAESENTATAEPDSSDGNTTIDQDRLDTAFLAAGEIEALLGMLARERIACGDGQVSSDQHDLVMGTALARMKELNSVVLSVVGYDNLRATEELQGVVHHD